MDNTEHRLTTVFENVFPSLAPDQIRSASQESVKDWDSVAAITLMNLVEEEFGIEMDFDELADLTSFQQVLKYLNKRHADTAA